MLLLVLLPSCVGFHATATPQRSAMRGVSPLRMDLSGGYDPASYDPEQSGLGLAQKDDGRPEGSHSTGYHFMPLATCAKDSSPVVLCIAGAYPGMTAEQLLAPNPLPFAPPGRWNYHVLTGDAAPGGFVALPGSQLLDDHPNAVAVVCTGVSLGLSFSDGNDHEVIAIIDRSDIATVDRAGFSSKDFYALADADGAVHIRWIQDLPAGWRVLGRLLYTQMPYVGRPGGTSGFAEGNDDFEF